MLCEEVRSVYTKSKNDYESERINWASHYHGLQVHVFPMGPHHPTWSRSQPAGQCRHDLEEHAVLSTGSMHPAGERVPPHTPCTPPQPNVGVSSPPPPPPPSPQGSATIALWIPSTRFKSLTSSHCAPCLHTAGAEKRWGPVSFRAP